MSSNLSSKIVQAILSKTVGNTADGRVAFSELHFDKAGTYTYTVEEVKGTNEDIIYDGGESDCLDYSDPRW